VQNKDDERRPIWERIRRHYKKNLAVAPPEDEDRVKSEYRAAKTKQFRKQFKEDYPEYERQIDGDPELNIPPDPQLQALAQNDIKRIIQSFYGITELEDYKSLTAEYEIKETLSSANLKQLGIILGALGFVSSVGIYDAYKVCFSNSPPSKIINLAAVGVTLYVITLPPIEKPKNNFTLTLNDIVYAKHSKQNPEKFFPNYKTRLQNETTTNERNH
jgi:hypothetical protein